MTDIDTVEQEHLQVQVGKAWSDLLEVVGYVHDPSYNLSNKPEVALRLGTILFDHMTASIYDMSWEGYSADDLVGIVALFDDILLGAKNS